MEKELLDALGARSGLVCLVGAGGKKTTLYRLAAAHPGRVGVTSSVHIPPFPAELDAREVIARQDRLLSAVVAAAGNHRKVAFAQPSEKPRRLAGVEPALIAQIHAAAGFDITLVKADGARSRWIKAPDPTEPQLPQDIATVIPVVSARALGQPLSERISHRLERIETITGARRGEILAPLHIARLLVHRQGALRGVGTAQVAPLVNMVDDARCKALAVETAERALALCERFDRVVLASMKSSEPLVAVVDRGGPRRRDRRH